MNTVEQNHLRGSVPGMGGVSPAGAESLMGVPRPRAGTVAKPATGLTLAPCAVTSSTTPSSFCTTCFCMTTAEKIAARFTQA